MPVPRRDAKALKTVSRLLKREPHTVDQIRGEMKVSERTVYRWLKYLQQAGHDVVSRRDDEGVVYFSIVAEKEA